MIINDLLAYANSYRGSCGNSKLYNACLREFDDTEIYDAKELLYAEYQEILGIHTVQKGEKKKNSSLEDIFKALDELVDRREVSVLCAFINVKAIPKYNPEELVDSSMIQRIIKLETIIKQHSARLDENYARVVDTKNEIDASLVQMKQVPAWNK